MNQNTLTPHEYKQAQYTLWQPLEETWSAPASYAEALEAYARDPELQAAIINQDGTAGQPEPFAEITRRAETPEPAPAPPAEQRSPMQSIANTLNTPIHLPRPERRRRRHTENTSNALPRETINRLNHALGLFIILTYASLYISAASAIIIGLTTENHIISIAGIIVGVGTFFLHQYLTPYED